jgi:hypothetical protein
VNGGTFTQGGTLNGGGTLTLNTVTSNFNNAFTLGALNISGGAATLATNVSTAALALDLSGTTINGPGTITNPAGQTLTLLNTTIAANSGLDNQGTLVANGTVTVNGPFTTAGTSLLRLQPNGSTGFSNFSVPGTLTNNGAIELTTTVSAYSATLNVSGTGLLTNAPTGTITTLVGTGGPRTIAAQLDNQGLVTLNQPLTLSHASAAHSNSGTIDASGADFTLTQSGTAPSFTNLSTGRLTVGAGRTLTVNGGTFTQGGTLNGGGTLTLNTVTSNFNNAFTLGALNVTGGTASFATDLSTGVQALNFVAAAINGPGTITNPVGQTLTIQGATFNTDLINQGTLVTDGASTVAATNAFTASAGSMLRLRATGSTGNSTFTAAPFTNDGAIELTTTVSAYSATLNVSGTGLLTNAPTGTITTLVGTGGPRTINAQVNNLGSITVHPGPSSSGILNIIGSLTTSGTLNMELGGTVAGAGYSHVTVTGVASLGGTLNFSLINAFAPTSGNVFDILTSSGTLSGTLALGAQPGGWAPPIYPANSVRLTAP